MTLLFTLFVLIITFILPKSFKKFSKFFKKFLKFLFKLFPYKIKKFLSTEIISYLINKKASDIGSDTTCIKELWSNSKDINSIKVNETSWKKIINIFSTEHRKESYSLAKKNNFIETMEYKPKHDEITFSDISNVRHYINLFHTFQSSLYMLNKEKNNKNKNNYLEEEKLLANIVCKFKMINYNMNFTIAFKSLFKTIYFLIIFVIITMFIEWVILNLKIQFPNLDVSIFNLIEYNDVLMFALGIATLFLIVPLSYIYYTYEKFDKLKIWVGSNHTHSGVFSKNLSYYTSTFLVSILLLSISIALLSNSGIEYNNAFHFIASLMLPIMDLNTIPALLAYEFKDDVIFGIFSIKIIFLLFLFSLGLLFIQYVIELYIQVYDDHKDNIYSIPPEFAKFFSYLMLSIFTIILLYGTLFINYPNLSKSYNECRPYLQEKMSKEKSGNTNHLSKTYRYCIDYNNSDTFNVPSYIQKECQEFLASDTYDKNDTSLSVTHCNILMNYYVFDQNKSDKTPKFATASRTLSDYLPLSIFLALFGTLIMIATRNLLENYFTGLSLKIDPPFDEGERVRIDDGEMLAVDTIGFRATTFYGISSNAHLVIPHETLKKSIITNYTQPTLDYRERITIYVPDTNHDKSIPREAEKVLLLAAFTATGVKKPRFTEDTLTDVEIFDKYKIADLSKDYKDTNDRIENYIKDPSEINKENLKDKLNNLDIEKELKDITKKYINNDDALKNFIPKLIDIIWNDLPSKSEDESPECVGIKFLNDILDLNKCNEKCKKDIDTIIEYINTTKDNTIKNYFINEINSKFNREFKKNFEDKEDKNYLDIIKNLKNQINFVKNEYKNIYKNIEDLYKKYKYNININKFINLIESNNFKLNIETYIKNIKGKVFLDSSINKLKDYEEEKEVSNLINKIFDYIKKQPEKEQKKVSLDKVFKLIKEYDSTELNDKELAIIKKLIVSIYSVLYQYKKEKKLKYHIDKYLIKRKHEAFKDIGNKDIKNMSSYLVNINYYYFALAKQLWELKDNDDSTQRKKDFDHASLDLLDVPRITSEHKRDIDGAFWEITLLVTVELGEQSDEIIQHINMFIDTLWGKFKLPYRCILNNDNSISAKEFNNKEERNKAILKDIDNGLTIKKVAKKYKLSESWIKTIYKIEKAK